MPRIVSGTGQSVNQALLEGLQIGRSFRDAQDSRERNQLRLQEAMAEMQKERAKALADANKRAQYGELQALQQQDMERIAAGLPPEAKMLGDYVGLRKSLTEREADPELIDELDKSFGEVQQGIQYEKSTKAAEEEIQRAFEDGMIDEAGKQSYESRLTAKKGKREPVDDILTEFSGERMKRAEDAANTEENIGLFDQAQAIAQSIPQGSQASKATRVALKAYEMAPSLQKKPGSGAKLVATIQQIAAQAQGQQDKQYAAQQQHVEPFADPKLRSAAIDDLAREKKKNPKEEDIRAKIALVNPGATSPFAALAPADPSWRPDSDRTPNESLERSLPNRAKAKKGVSKEAPRAVQSALDGGATSPKEILESLKKAGVPITRENLEAAKAEILSYKSGKTAATGGADRKRLVAR